MHGSIPQIRCPSSSETILSEKRLKRLKFQVRANFVSHRYFQDLYRVFLAAVELHGTIVEIRNDKKNLRKINDASKKENLLIGAVVIVEEEEEEGNEEEKEEEEEEEEEGKEEVD
ncbi:hypothetical protein HZH68_016097 [Vespula germanica]|uniref:Uncharacterized protein n=1 Tax=Vespula germanica TaxID=30212 RepID=A0A834J601_VESGE|nr:hypothetical protein HZH68_016097 [Vespula germanica]